MLLAFSPLPMPEVLSRHLDAYARRLSQPKGVEFDFSSPPGEPALLPPDSVSWQVFKNPVTLFIGGISAVILELAEPQVRDGVWQHTSFRTDAVPRLQRTALAAMATVYGAESRVSRMIDGINRRHAAVSGVTREGHPYRADDPLLLDWVHATACYGFMEAFSTYARPLTEVERNHMLAEGEAAAHLYGAGGVPTSLSDMNVLFEVMRHRLVKSDVVFEFLDIMRTVPLLPAPLRFMQGLFVKAAIEILPPWVRDRLDLWTHWSLSPTQRRLVDLAAYGTDRLMLPSSAPVQACKRLGLPANYLYRKPPAAV
ncbi:oxygenase MpaB family protein [Rhizobium halophytocola]|uniref:Uncharacterized protein (DUF2236 family) n=1 Tax=Rhizobium halophytocola TaxID=735519 RepID=A0ABS4E3S8_9HYPH|nr:oxygenase MpaB family protein [Rhizobium halophytocola]MBP1852605.1 uncharacterized protein (DUF2236 family) [Rhizobium halophytocola]